MLYVLLTTGITALAYQFLALFAAIRHLLRREPPSDWTPGVSILKPVRGLDAHFYEAIRSHAVQDYPKFEILFGVGDPEDPAIAEIERLKADFPDVKIRLICSERKAPNHKVGVLEDLTREARHEILLVNDSDIHVSPDYLRQVVAPLEMERVGLVTCLYRAGSAHLPGRMEALGIATDFAPSVLVAPLVGVNEFGLGSTLVFRREQLEQIGGFAAIADYLADDYQLARRIVEHGFRVHLSRLVVETSLLGETWAEMWRHQLRWYRTIRLTKGKGYLGIPITQATMWAIVAAAAGLWWLAGALLAARLATGMLVGVAVLHCRVTAWYFPLIPVRDLFGMAVWAAGLVGKQVEWRGQKLRLSPDGRILR